MQIMVYFAAMAVKYVKFTAIPMVVMKRKGLRAVHAAFSPLISWFHRSESPPRAKGRLTDTSPGGWGI